VKRNKVFLHLERWLNDNIPFPKEVYRKYINSLYKNNELVNDKLEINSKLVEFSNIKTPILNVIAKNDNIVSYNAAKSLTLKVKSKINDLIEIEAGHIGVVMGKKAKETWEKTLEWFFKVNNIKNKKK
jgi:polyhydroxyalkanoate synthase